MTQTQWEGLVREHSPLVWRVVYRLVGNEADACDCMQETFAGAWKIAQRKTIENWGGMLQRLATARGLDHLRQKVRRRKHFDARDLREMASGEVGPVAAAQHAELAQQLREALAELPSRLSEIYCLRHLNGMTYDEIAQELNMKTSAVGVALHRATQRLRAALSVVLLDESQSGRST